jgi:hydrogenase maturation protease
VAFQVAQGHRRSSAVAGAAVVSRIPANLLVLGIGNTLLGDDGFGIRAMEHLRARSDPPGASYVDGGTLSFSLLGHLEHADALLVIDAAELEAAPGTVRAFEAESMDRFLSSSRRRSVHEVGLCDLLDMARLLGCLPPLRALVCVQPGNTGWSDSLSAPIADALPAANAQATSILARWAGAP